MSEFCLCRPHNNKENRAVVPILLSHTCHPNKFQLEVLVKDPCRWRDQEKRDEDDTRSPEAGPAATLPHLLPSSLRKAWPFGLSWLRGIGVEVGYCLVILIFVAQLILTYTE